MKQRAPFVCDICGQDVSGSNPFFEVKISEFGLSAVHGRFCSLDHAREWVAARPALEPLKKQFVPGAPGVAASGLRILLGAGVLLALLVIGVVEVLRTALSWV